MRTNGSGKMVCLFCRADKLYREKVRVGPNPHEVRIDIRYRDCGKPTARIT